MSSLTAALYGALIVYLGGWFLGHWTGNFSLLLFMLTVVTLVYWLAERFASSRRARPLPPLEQQDAARRAELAKMGIAKVDGDVRRPREKLLMQPWWLDWTAGLFPVILIVFLLRSFLFEPFKIPSGSMIPTLLVGDLILVNKFHYGVRLPVINKKIIANNDPSARRRDGLPLPGGPAPGLHQARGRHPGRRGHLQQPEAVASTARRWPPSPRASSTTRTACATARMFSEKLGAVEHRILVDPKRRQAYYGPDPKTFPMAENCRYTGRGA
jgi:signal peptidase I